MTLDEVAVDIAKDLLAMPVKRRVAVWRTADGFVWSSTNQPPAGASVVAFGLPDNSDGEETNDPIRVDGYASDIAAWLQREL